MFTTLSTFDIREHLERLTPSLKGGNYYECPVCGGSSLSIEPKSGKYKCWSGDCAPAAIREAIRPWNEAIGSQSPATYRRTAKKAACRQPKPAPAPIPANLKLLRQREPARDCPAREQLSDALWKIVRNDSKLSNKNGKLSKKIPVSRAELKQIAYSYGDGKTVYRVEWPDESNPKGRDKTYRQSHTDASGKRIWKKGDGFWPAYRIDEAIELLRGVPDGEPTAVLLLEGEPNVELARFHGIAALTLQGSNWGDKEIAALLEALRATGKNIALVVLRDSDSTGEKKAAGVRAVAHRLQFPCIAIDPVAIYPDIPDKGDIKEILDAMDADEFIRRLEAQIHAAVSVIEGERDALDTDSDGYREQKQPKPPTPRELACSIAEDYGHLWRLDGSQECWRVWTGSIWQKAKDADFRVLVKRTIDARGVAYKGPQYITDTIKLLADDLRVESWETWDRARYIAFKNSVLDGDTGETIQHSPGMGFTSHLPYEYKAPKASHSDPIDALRENCPSTYRWMSQAMQHDPKKMLKLVAVVNGVLKFRFFELQMFVHLVGKPGTGKGTFSRLLEKIVGRDNWQGCKLKNLDDGSTMASIIDKQLVVCPDERAAIGVDAILSLTGGDSISFREVYKQAADAFFYGLLLVGSNNPIFVGDTTGLDRRLCLVEFGNPVPAELRNPQIEEAMVAEIPQLIALCLQMPADTVKAAILGKGLHEIADFKRREWEMKIQTNSVAAYFDERLIVDPTASTPTGKLYEDYKERCALWGLKAVSHIKYPKVLEELLIDHLQQSGVKYEKSGGRSRFVGLRIRADADIDTPFYSDTLGASTGFDGVGTGSVRGLKPLPNGNYSDLRDLEAKTLENFSAGKVGGNGGCESAALRPTEKNADKFERSTPSNPTEKNVEKLERPTPSNPVETPESLLDGNSNPVTNPVATPLKSRGNPVTEPESEATPPAAAPATPPPAAPSVAAPYSATPPAPAPAAPAATTPPAATPPAAASIESISPATPPATAPIESNEPPAAASIESNEPPTLPAAASIESNEPPTPQEQIEPATELNESEVELVGFVRMALADAEPETAKQVQGILKEVCGSGAADRAKVWGALAPAEQTEFSGLLKAPHAPSPAAAPEPEPAAETISPNDAEAMRDIALVWWDEYYPEQLQTLLAQMFGWGAPFDRYGREAIAQWLESQEELVRARIGELMGLHFSSEVPGPSSPPENEIDCGF